MLWFGHNLRWWWLSARLYRWLWCKSIRYFFRQNFRRLKPITRLWRNLKKNAVPIRNLQKPQNIVYVWWAVSGRLWYVFMFPAELASLRHPRIVRAYPTFLAEEKYCFWQPNVTFDSMWPSDTRLSCLFDALLFVVMSGVFITSLSTHDSSVTTQKLLRLWLAGCSIAF